MSTPLEKNISELATQALAAHGLVCVQAKLSGGSSGRGQLTLQVLAEKPDGSSPNVDECTQASRTLSAQLDVADIITSRYILEVGSPGLERPLLSPQDCQRFQGRHARFQFESRQKFPGLAVEVGAITGVITAISGTEITLTGTDAPQPITFPFSLVRQAHLSPTEEELNQLMKQVKTQPKE